MPDRIYHRLSNSRQLIVKGEQLFLQEEESPQCFKGLLVIIPTLLIWLCILFIHLLLFIYWFQLHSTLKRKYNIEVFNLFRIRILF